MTDTTLQYCEHCWPSKRTAHWDLHADYYFTKLLSAVDKFIRPVKFFQSKFAHKLSSKVWSFYIQVFSFIGIIKFVPEPDEALVNVRNLIFFKEAKRRGIDIAVAKLLGKKGYSNEFRFYYRGKRYHYEGIPLTMRGASFHLDNKIETKRLIKKNGLPVPEGEAFTNPEKAVKFAERIGYPLVVKPNTGSLAHHVICGINNEQELRKAIAISKQYQPAFIVERYLTGGMHRGTVIDRKHVFICLRDKANVVGDGVLTIKELIEQKNADPRRGPAFDASASLHKMPLDEVTISYLASQGLSLESIPPQGQKVYLYASGKLLPDRGNDIIDFTDEAHPDNIALYLKIAELLNTDLVGIDFICEDITRSWKDQTCGVLEANSVPYVDMHQAPSHGKPIPIAELVWDSVLAELDGNRV